MTHLPKAQQIRQLLLVFCAGIAAAGALAFGMLHYYNPSGAYLAKNVLLAPQAINSLHFTEKGMRFVLDDFSFSYYDTKTKHLKRLHVDMPQYEAFYDFIGRDKSLENVPGNLISFFSSQGIASLDLEVKTETNHASHPLTQLFLRVEFTDEGNYYRTQLRTQGEIATWAYFYHPHIYQEALKFFIPLYD